MRKRVRNDRTLPSHHAAHNIAQTEGDDVSSVDRVALYPILTPNGHGTDIWQALKEQLHADVETSAIVIATDGQHNGTESPLALIGPSGIPVFTVGIGDPTRPQNLSVTDIYVRDKTRPSEPFEIEALLYAEDIAQDSVKVELIRHTIDLASGEWDAGEVIEARSVETPPHGGRMRIDFQTLSGPTGTLRFYGP